MLCHVHLPSVLLALHLQSPGFVLFLLVLVEFTLPLYLGVYLGLGFQKPGVPMVEPPVQLPLHQAQPCSFAPN